jgi:drug/metabolite transporter (DMT)-like permease
MIRVVLTEALLFLTPFLIFAVVLLLQRRRILDIEHWSGSTAWLAMAGLLLVLGGFLYKGFVADRPERGFEPAHMENGQFVPGRFKE